MAKRPGPPKTAASTAPKAAKPKSAAMKAAPVASPSDSGPKVTPTPQTSPGASSGLIKPVEAGAQLKKKDLIDRVVAQVPGVKKKDAKPVIEAMLAVMGQAMSDGAHLNVQPYGKVRVQKLKRMPNGQVLTLKLRRSTHALRQTEGLAEPRSGG